MLQTAKKVGAVYVYMAAFAVIVMLGMLFITGCQEQRHIEQLNTAKAEGEAYIVEGKEGSEWFARSKNHAGTIYFTDDDITGGDITPGQVVWAVFNEDGTEVTVTGDF